MLRRGRLYAQAAFTLIELIAAVALLVILLGILFVVFGEAGRTVHIGRERMARYRTVRAIFRMMEEDITSAFLMEDYAALGDPKPEVGFTGEDGTDDYFLYDDALPPSTRAGYRNGREDAGEELPDSDRLTLIRPRRTPGTNEPGFIEVRYLRQTYDPGEELFADQRNYLFRAIDDNAATPWTTGNIFPPGFLDFTHADPDPANESSPVNEYYRNYLLALNVSDLQFEYLQVGSSTWTTDGDWNNPPSPTSELPGAVRVTIRLGSDRTNNLNDPDEPHDTFTHVIFLPTAP